MHQPHNTKVSEIAADKMRNEWIEWVFLNKNSMLSESWKWKRFFCMVEEMNELERKIEREKKKTFKRLDVITSAWKSCNRWWKKVILVVGEPAAECGA